MLGCFHGVTSMGARGQLVIPKKLRDSLEIKKRRSVYGGRKAWWYHALADRTDGTFYFRYYISSQRDKKIIIWKKK